MARSIPPGSKAVNRREQQVKAKYEAEGWKVLRNGAPDFVCMRLDEAGSIVKMLGLEVKPPNGQLTYEQAVYQKIFQWAGVPYQVVAEA